MKDELEKFKSIAPDLNIAMAIIEHYVTAYQDLLLLGRELSPQGKDIIMAILWKRHEKIEIDDKNLTGEEALEASKEFATLVHRIEDLIRQKAWSGGNESN